MTPRPLLKNACSLSTKTISNPRTLLLTFDAFDTLFHPRQPVQEQYAAAAHEFGFSRTAITPDKIKAAFKDVFRSQMARYPNYGRADVLRGQYGGPKQWWEEVIRGCFTQILSQGNENASAKKIDITSEMLGALLDRFAGAEGYALYPDVVPFFKRMRELKSSHSSGFDRVVVGVISNSDDRIPAVLKALGLKVGDLRADQDVSSMALPGFEQRDTTSELGKPGKVNDKEPSRIEKSLLDNDLNMIITSYEAGEEKPNRLIFDVAEQQARLLVQQPTGAESGESWTRVHVGDDYAKDYIAAREAGWQSYLVRGNAQDQPAQKLASLMDLIHELRMGS
ncbi:hypothetical protein N7478_001847 [Penicillium angulare]|uniref:uncharacterized protein n=1 Tax=Penicillium angulare TaxID=116970 RepID=UPI002542011D|nr:uncharacterized protein N7478_001847 [Penicillium angulare]KAJ5288817.1 hypothetical protein N7478_001847 [Penicillium angulare]